MPIPPGEKLEFAWSNFEQSDPKLSVEFYRNTQQVQAFVKGETKKARLLNISQMQQQPATVKVCLDELNETKTIKLGAKGPQRKKVFAKIYRGENYKVLEFEENQDGEGLQNKAVEESMIEEETKDNKNKKKTGHILEGKDKDTMTLEIAQVNVSCIH